MAFVMQAFDFQARAGSAASMDSTHGMITPANSCSCLPTCVQALILPIIRSAEDMTQVTPLNHKIKIRRAAKHASASSKTFQKHMYLAFMILQALNRSGTQGCAGKPVVQIRLQNHHETARISSCDPWGIGRVRMHTPTSPAVFDRLFTPVPIPVLQEENRQAECLLR